MTRIKPAEPYRPWTDRHRAISRAFALARVDTMTVSAEGVVIHRNHIEYDEIQRDPDGVLLVRHGWAVTKRRVVRNPNPRLADKERS